MNTILAIVIVLNLALVGILVYWIRKQKLATKFAQAVHQEAIDFKQKAHDLFAHAQKTATLAEHESAHEVCNECGKIVTRYEKDVESAKVTCIDCISKIASRAL